ncbi:enolase C-terminal domain-like protein [Streptomyces sp. CA-106131]|uniref:enolase C-terminal domain-like protein n=1 Tax=Streptomyces sp. CA-106131 TaxID=3240045 RepID=UPI003D948733
MPKHRNHIAVRQPAPQPLLITPTETTRLDEILEPLPADDLTGHVELARTTRIPVAVGESLYSLGQFRQYLESRGGERHPG